MGFLASLIYLFSMAMLLLLFGVVAWGFLGMWLFVLIFLFWLAHRLDGVWRESQPGEFWRNVGARLASPRSPKPVPRFEAPAYGPSLPAHVSALAADLRPLLARMYQALHQPDSLSVDVRLGGVSSRLTEIGAALGGMHQALMALKEDVVETPYGDDDTRMAAVARIDGAAATLLGAYASVYAGLREQPGDPRLTRLEHNLRANLERLSMWLASLLLVLQEPERILLEGEPEGGSSMAMTFNLRFSWPESLQELDTWTDTPTGYDAGHVRAALEPDGPALRADVRAEAMIFQPARRTGGSDWLTPFLVGWIIGDWLDGDDGDDTA